MTPSLEPIITHAPTRPLDVLPTAYENNRKGVAVVSVYPGDLRKQCRHNGTTTYEIPKPPRGQYSQLFVYDTQQWVRMASEQGPRYDQWVPGPIPARIVAESLVQEWAGNIIRPRKCTSTIGVGIIKDDSPTVEELTRLHAGQNNMFNAFIQEANSFYIAGKALDITDIHRTSAFYLLDQGAENLAWYPKIDFSEVKVCIACGNKIKALALRCQHCTTFLPQIYMDYGLVAVEDKAVAEFLSKVKMPKKPVPTVSKEM